MNKNFVIHTKMLETTIWIFNKIITFPKKQRFVLGQQIENSSLTCLRLICEVNNSETQEESIKKLMNLNVELEILRDLLRMAYEMQFITSRSLGYIVNQIDEVGKMCGSWLKRQKVSLSNKSN